MNRSVAEVLLPVEWDALGHIRGMPSSAMHTCSQVWRTAQRGQHAHALHPWMLQSVLTLLLARRWSMCP